MATGTESPPGSAPRRPVAPPARRADGIELIGEYEGSGFKEAPYIARREDGQVIQLTRLLHLVAEEIDGTRSYRQIAEAVSRRFGRRVSAGNIQFLVERKLRPLGVLAAADGTSPKTKKAEPLLALRFRTALVPEQAVVAMTTVLRPLFLPPVVAVALLGVVALDGWLFFVHGMAQSARESIYDPALLFFLFVSVLAATAFHECGHATACRYGGARPGVLGAGVYIVYPVFYCDVTDAYRLDRRGRLRTDLGGVYFNALFALLAGAAYFATSFEPLLLVVVLQHLAILQQLLPLLRLDGYYVMSDLTGVPDILVRIKPILRSLVPGARSQPEVEALKPWVRIVVSAYVALLVPFFALVLVLLITAAPRMFATAWDSLGIQVARVRDGASDGQILDVAAGALQSVALVLPCAGLTVSFSRLGGRAGGGLKRWAAGDRRRTAGVATAGAAALAFVLAVWWPNGDYRPIQPGETGTFQGGVQNLSEIPTGRPSLTPQREAELGGAPTERQREATEPDGAEPPKAEPGGPQDERTDPPDRSPRGDEPTTEPDGRSDTPADVPAERPPSGATPEKQGAESGDGAQPSPPSSDRPPSGSGSGGTESPGTSPSGDGASPADATSPEPAPGATAPAP